MFSNLLLPLIIYVFQKKSFAAYSINRKQKTNNLQQKQKKVQLHNQKLQGMNNHSLQ